MSKKYSKQICVYLIIAICCITLLITTSWSNQSSKCGMNDQSRQPEPYIESDLSELNVYPCFMPNEPCVDKIVEWIYGAQESIIVQAYSFSSMKIAHALLKVKSIGAKVKMMIDRYAEEKQNSLIQVLKNNGIEIQVDEQTGKAHNKVMIIDNEHVITGSYNWTDEQYYNDSDVIVFIKDTCVNKKFRYNYEALNRSYSNNYQIPKNTIHSNSYYITGRLHTKGTHPYPMYPIPYSKPTNPFNWQTYTGMYDCGFCSVPFLNDSSSYTDKDRFTESTTRNKKKKQKSENFVEVDVCFPRFNNQDCIELISSYINNAKKSIFIQACSLTHRKILNALIGAHKKNIDIKLLVDKKVFDDRGEQVSTLIDSSIEVRCDTTYHPGIAHSKTIIIDNDLVLTGSLNLTYNAQNINRENLLRMKNIYVNRIFKEKFYTKWNESIKGIRQNRA